MRQLHYFNHGLGDCCQFTSVIKHLKKDNPNLIIDVCTSIGKNTCFQNLADNVFLNSKKHLFSGIIYDKVFSHGWPENHNSYKNYPSTKTVKCISEMFKIQTHESLLNYTINIDENSINKVKEYIQTIPVNKGIVCIHYQGNTATGQKNLEHDLIKKICNYLIIKKYTPIILDWDKRSTIINNKTIFCPGSKNLLWSNYGVGDASTIAALIDKAELFIGIDSGPLHVAMSTNTKSFGIWTRHHPIHFADLSKNTTHFVPKNHHTLVKGSNNDKALNYFYNKYNYKVYDNLYKNLCEEIEKMTNTETKKFATLYNKDSDRLLNSYKYDENYYKEHKNAGLDYINYGGWQQKYSDWIVDSFNLKNKRLIDLGCACGSIAYGFHKSGAKVSAIDINNYTVKIGKEKFSNLDINVCDCVNMHLFKDKEFQFVHCNQVAEHWRPEHVDMIFKEISRILKDDGLFLCILDTEELYIRQKRNPLKEDPTHICIKPMNWWLNIAKNNNFEKVNDEKFINHEKSYFKSYDWDYFLLRKNNKLKNKFYI